MISPPQDINVTLIQSSLVWEDKSANLEQFAKKIEELADNTDLIILPEMFNTGFSMNTDKLAESMEGITVSWMKEQAALSKAVVIGSLIVEEEGQYFNRLIWMQPDGVFDTYDKRHLFRMGNEDQYFTPGQNRLIIEWKGWRICPQVCYDLRFPVWHRNKQDYDLLLFVANWPQRRSAHWRSLLLARAIENQAYVIGLNRTGTDGNGVEHQGDSAVISPKGEYIYQKSIEEDVATVVLDAATLRHYREVFPVWRDSDDFSIK